MTRRNVALNREPSLIAGHRELAGCRKLAQLVAAPKVILPRSNFGTTCGRRSPLAERLNCGKPRRKRTSRGETRDRLDTSYRVRKFVITIGDRHSGGTDILVGAAPSVVWMRVGCHWRLVRPMRSARRSRRTNGGVRREDGDIVHFVHVVVPCSLLQLLNPALQAYHECEMCQRARLE